MHVSNEDSVVVTNNLTKRYGEFTALDSLSLNVNRGNILGLIGPNGAGKTTAIKMLVGMARPTAGSASIAGVDCYREARRIKRLVGYMPDRFGSYDNMRVYEYLDFFAAAFGISAFKRKRRIEAVMEITKSTYMRDRYVEALSHGMQQRIGIARTLVHDPEVLILDEPANGLDPEARVEMRDLLLQLAKMQKTLIVTSHILPELSRICDQVAIISSGKLRAFGTLAEIARQISRNRFLEAQLSSVESLDLATTLVREHLEEDAEVTPSKTESVVRFRTAKDETVLGDLLAALVQNGIPVTQFRELQTDLEDAFLSVTRADAAESNAAKANDAESSDENSETA
ncbi:MAG TPA: ABC transporter ATP-binding protein [Planctomycetaceae bacterium]|nr:ABC transporter ATP-binding protein [Planctomycetaceae bacterium]